MLLALSNRRAKVMTVRSLNIYPHILWRLRPVVSKLVQELDYVLDYYTQRRLTSGLEKGLTVGQCSCDWVAVEDSE